MRSARERACRGSERQITKIVEFMLLIVAAINFMKHVWSNNDFNKPFGLDHTV